MRKTTAAATMLVALAATVFVPSASAREKFDTEIQVLDAFTFGVDFYIYGVLDSDKTKCVRDREMVVLVDTGTETQPRDGGRSSNSGAWALIAEDDDASGISVTVKRERLRNGNVCKKASVDVPF